MNFKKSKSANSIITTKKRNSCGLFDVTPALSGSIEDSVTQSPLKTTNWNLTVRFLAALLQGEMSVCAAGSCDSKEGDA